MTYTVGQDPLCYPGSTVLMNKAGLMDQGDLEAFELEMFLTRSREPLPNGNFDILHYRSVHHHLFQDVYDWAGQFRTIRIGKNGNCFCYPEFIVQNLEDLFERLAKNNRFYQTEQTFLPRQAALFLSELNAIHPYREGNGRSQMTFLGLLLLSAGFTFRPESIIPHSILNAMIASFSGQNEPLETVISDLIAH